MLLKKQPINEKITRSLIHILTFVNKYKKPKNPLIKIIHNQGVVLAIACTCIKTGGIRHITAIIKAAIYLTTFFKKKPLNVL